MVRSNLKVKNNITQKQLKLTKKPEDKINLLYELAQNLFHSDIKQAKKDDVKRFKDQSASGVNSMGKHETGERYLVLEALRNNGWNIAKAAKSIGLTRSQLVRILRKYGFRDVL